MYLALEFSAILSFASIVYFRSGAVNVKCFCVRKAQLEVDFSRAYWHNYTREYSGASGGHVTKAGRERRET